MIDENDMKEVMDKVEKVVKENAAKIKEEIQPSLDKVDDFMDKNGKKMATYVAIGMGVVLAIVIVASIAIG